MANLPTVITTAGLQPQSPQNLQAQLLATVAGVVPGYTAELPGILIEDIASTDVYSIVICDQARVETVNSLDPRSSNDYLTLLLGQQAGVPLGLGSNTSIFVIFTGLPGFVIAKGFTVSDGNFQYVLQDGGIIGTSGQSDQLFALATIDGTWAVPAGTVTQLVTPPPAGFTLAVVNPEPGVPGTSTETAASYRSRVLQTGLAASQGMYRYLKTYLGNVPGVQPRLISAQQVNGKWLITSGGGDPYATAYAISRALFDINTIVGSELDISGITQALPGVVTTFLNHGYAPGQVIAIAGTTPSGFNGAFVILTVPTGKTFSLGKAYPANLLTALAWSGGTVTATTTTPHGITIGSTFTIAGAAPAGYNGTFIAIAGTTGSTLKWSLVSNPGTETAFGQVVAGVALFDASALTYVSGGILTPNLRNILVTITDYPDTYQITYVNPPQQVVTMTVTWNTSSPNFVAPAAMAQLGAQPLADYINSIFSGKPINVDTMRSVFRAATAVILNPELLTRLIFAVSINGVGTSVDAGTDIIEGDPQSYMFATAAGINIVQG